MIKLNNLLEDVIREDDSEAADQAHKLGLTSGGWGTWKDKSGATVAKTVQGKLVKLEPGQGGSGAGGGNVPPAKPPVGTGGSDGTDDSETGAHINPYDAGADSPINKASSAASLDMLAGEPGYVGDDPRYGSGIPKLSSMVPPDSSSKRTTKPSRAITQKIKSLPGFAGDHELIDSLPSHTDVKNAMNFYKDTYNPQRGTFDVDADVESGDAFGYYTDPTKISFDTASEAWPYLKFDEKGNYAFNTKQYTRDSQDLMY